MQKNVASQKLVVFAFDSTTNVQKTGDAANITAYVSKDYGSVTVLGDTSATEMDSTNAKGYYLFDLTQGETNADTLLFSAKSSTANIVVVGAPATVFTTPPNFNLESIDGNGRLDIIKVAGTTQTARDIGASVLLSTGTGTGQLDFTSGVVKANATQLLGGTIPTPNVTGVPLVDLKYTLGTLSPATAGTVRADSVTGNVSGTVGGFAAGQGPRIRKNVALANFMFLMTDSTVHAPATGKTVAVTRSIDGGAFAAGTLSAVTEVSSGWYRVDFGAGDLNGDVVAFRATATACDDRDVTLITNP